MRGFRAYFGGRGVPFRRDTRPIPGSNLDLVRRVVAAFNRRDLEAILDATDPGIELDTRGVAGVSGGVYRGHAGLRVWHRDVDEAWEEVEIELDSYRETGNRIFACYELRGRGRQSGIEVAMRPGMVAELRDGRVVRMTTYPDRETALGEAGLSEADLRPA